MKDPPDKLKKYVKRKYPQCNGFENGAFQDENEDAQSDLIIERNLKVDMSKLNVDDIVDPKLDKTKSRLKVDIGKLNMSKVNVSKLSTPKKVNKSKQNMSEEVNDTNQKYIATKLDLTKIGKTNLDQEKLNQTKLSQTKLNQAKLNQTKLNQAIVNQAKSNQANLDQANLDQANFDQAKLDQPNLDHAKLDPLKIDLAKLDQANSTKLDPTKHKLDFLEQKLQRSDSSNKKPVSTLESINIKFKSIKLDTNVDLSPERLNFKLNMAQDLDLPKLKGSSSMENLATDWKETGVKKKSINGLVRSESSASGAKKKIKSMVKSPISKTLSAKSPTSKSKSPSKEYYQLWADTSSPNNIEDEEAPPLPPRSIHRPLERSHALGISFKPPVVLRQHKPKKMQPEDSFGFEMIDIDEPSPLFPRKSKSNSSVNSTASTSFSAPSTSNASPNLCQSPNMNSLQSDFQATNFHANSFQTNNFQTFSSNFQIDIIQNSHLPSSCSPNLNLKSNSQSSFHSPRNQSPTSSVKSLTSPNIQSSRVQSPVFQSSRVQSPIIQSSRGQSPVIQSSRGQSPVIQTSRGQSPVFQTSRVQSPSLLQSSQHASCFNGELCSFATPLHKSKNSAKSIGSDNYITTLSPNKSEVGGLSSPVREQLCTPDFLRLESKDSQSSVSTQSSSSLEYSEKSYETNNVKPHKPLARQTSNNEQEGVKMLLEEESEAEGSIRSLHNDLGKDEAYTGSTQDSFMDKTAKLSSKANDLCKLSVNDTDLCKIPYKDVSINPLDKASDENNSEDVVDSSLQPRSSTSSSEDNFEEAAGVDKTKLEQKKLLLKEAQNVMKPFPKALTRVTGISNNLPVCPPTPTHHARKPRLSEGLKPPSLKCESGQDSPDGAASLSECLEINTHPLLKKISSGVSSPYKDNPRLSLRALTELHVDQRSPERLEQDGEASGGVALPLRHIASSRLPSIPERTHRVIKIPEPGEHEDPLPPSKSEIHNILTLLTDKEIVDF